MIDEQKIIEGNAIIGEFDGLRPGEIKLYGTPDYMCWSPLIQVIGTIEGLSHPKHGNFSVHIYSNVCTIEGSHFNPKSIEGINVYSNTTILDSKLESTWSAVVAFIKWFNQNLKQ